MNTPTQHFARRILICVSGLTPQVVTETIYALACQDGPWLPTEVHVITTRTGAERARLLLLSEGRDQFGKLCADYGLEGIRFDTDCIHVPRDARGEALEDIRDPDDNLAMADAILAAVAEFASDDDCALHVSLAGGRKSMGFFAGYALSLYGRQQDRLSHVLVSEGFETHAEFFFPPRTPQVLLDQQQNPLDTREARIDLADLPFVRLRSHLPSELMHGGRFAEVVTAAQRLQAKPELLVLLGERAIVCGCERIDLSPIGFVIYAWHAERCRQGNNPGVEPAEFQRNSQLRMELQHFGNELQTNELSSEAQKWEELELGADFDKHNAIREHGQWLAEQRTRANKRIRTRLGSAGEAIYGIASEKCEGRRTVHRLLLPADAITIVC